MTLGFVIHLKPSFDMKRSSILPAFFWVACLSAAFGVVLGDVDTSFSPPAGLNGGIFSIVPQTDGKILVGGGFTDVGGNTDLDKLVRLEANGMLDTSFTPPASLTSTVFSIALQADGKILVGGAFGNVDGNMDLDRIVRLEADGSVDTSFAPPAGLNSEVYSMVLQADGKILVGGFFSNVGGDADLDSLIRLEVNGTLDTSFTPPALMDNPAHSIVVQPDGHILVGGFFTDVGGDTNRDYLIRLQADGTLDTSFVPSVVLNGPVYSVVPQADGKILVGGQFTNVGGDANRDYLIRMDANGALDTSFDPPAGLSNTVQSIVPQADGKILVGGLFTNVGGDADLDRLVRLESDGTLDSTFAPPAGLNGEVTCNVPQADGTVLVGGSFTDVGGDTDLDRIFRADYEVGTRDLLVPNLQTIQWIPAGSTPLAYRVAFEASTDGGSTYRSVGEGSRVAGGWEYRGSNIPAVAIVRSIAFVRSGYVNGSVHLLEDTLAISYTANPILKLKGKKKIVTSRGSIVLRGNAIDADGDVRVVRFKDSRPRGKRWRNAKGTTNWKAKVKLKDGRNKVLVQAFDSRGVRSKTLKVTVIRK